MTTSLRSDLYAVYALLLREVKIYFREKERIVAVLVSPLLFLFVVGRGLSGHSPVPGCTYQQFIFPGILCMVILFTAITYGLYIIWDKRLDFLKEVLVAPISRSTLFLGKSLGGMAGAVMEAAILLAIGAAFVLPLGPLQLAAALVLSMLFAFLMANIGLGIGARMNSMEGFGLVMSFLTWPMFFFGGALFDLSRSGKWLRLAACLDPFTYCVDLMRWVMLGWGAFPAGLDLAAVLFFCAVTAAWGVVSFGRLQQTR
ncbi:MAG TPA: ABC transporter [Elusimicrobia bacterium]|nr:ABC transporter [Elusimicrobiota bacterium]HBT60314.1 ABC transporter [Elusimicrobiota bacterium]